MKPNNESLCIALIFHQNRETYQRSIDVWFLNIWIPWGYLGFHGQPLEDRPKVFTGF